MDVEDALYVDRSSHSMRCTTEEQATGSALSASSLIRRMMTHGKSDKNIRVEPCW